MVRIAAIGDNDVDCYLSTGQMYPGGNCLNVAVYARRFGAESAYVGAMADDPAGRLMRGALVAEGVWIDRLRKVPGLTAYCVIGHRGAERLFLTYDLGVSRFAPDNDDITYLADFDAAHVGQSSALDDWVPQITANTRLSYDFSTRLSEPHMARIAPHCWLASFSAGTATPSEARAMARRMRALGAKRVLATMGQRGALMLDDNGIVETPAQLVEAVDTLGAGDTFIARSLVGLLRGEAPEAALAAATEAAAQTCLYLGAIGHGAPIDLPVDLSTLDIEALMRAAD